MPSDVRADAQVSQWYPALILAYRAERPELKFLIHFEDDGEEIRVLERYVRPINGVRSEDGPTQGRPKRQRTRGACST